MTEEKNSRALKILTAVLTIGLIALGVYTISFYNENQKNIVRLEDEKANLEANLSELIVKYENAIEEKNIMAEELEDAKSRIELLLESLKKMDNTNYAMIKRYQNEIKNLEREREQLFGTVDSLSRQNARLVTAVDSTQSALRQRIVFSDSLVEQNEILSSKVAEGAKLKIANLVGEAVILKSSGKIVNTLRHRRADKIRACFNIAENALAVAEEKTLYIQIINPKNNIVGNDATVAFGEKMLSYSKSMSIDYNNQAIEVCPLIDAAKKQIIRGRYVVNVFDTSELIASSSFELK